MADCGPHWLCVCGTDPGSCPVHVAHAATEPAPAPEQALAFDLVAATLWEVSIAYRPAPGAQYAHLHTQLLTASPDGREVYPLALARTRELAPGALEITVVSIQRRAEVTGTVARRKLAPS